MLKVTIICILCPLFISLIGLVIDYIYFKKGKTTKEMFKTVLIARTLAAFFGGLLAWIFCAIITLLYG